MLVLYNVVCHNLGVADTPTYCVPSCLLLQVSRFPCTLICQACCPRIHLLARTRLLCPRLSLPLSHNPHHIHMPRLHVVLALNYCTPINTTEEHR